MNIHSHSGSKRENATGTQVDMKFELVVIPVSDADRSKQFYIELGWRLDIDYRGEEGYRVIQFTPPGSQTSVMFGRSISNSAPGSVLGLHLIVSDIMAARGELVGRGIEVGAIFHDVGGIFHHADGKGIVHGPNPGRKSYASYASFSDPDGNEWVLQEITVRLPGVRGDTSFNRQLTDAVWGNSK